MAHLGPQNGVQGSYIITEKQIGSFSSNSLKPIVSLSVSPAKSPLGPKGPSPPQELERSPP